MIERLLIVIVLSFVGFAAYQWHRRQHIARLAKLQATSDPVLRQLAPGVPAIVYFTTPGCIPCQTQQQPALHRLRETLGDDQIQIVKIDATEAPEIASQWGVMSAPTTFVLDAGGRTVSINHGVADADKLTRQLTVA